MTKSTPKADIDNEQDMESPKDLGGAVAENQYMGVHGDSLNKDEVALIANKSDLTFSQRFCYLEIPLNTRL